MGSAIVRANDLLTSLMDASLAQLCVGVGDLQLRFEDGQGITLEGPISLAGGEAGPCPPYGLEGLALTLPLLNEVVDGARVGEDGRLSLTIGSRTILCEPLDQDEAWNVTGVGALIVCLPGGDLSIFSDERPPPDGKR